MLVTGSALYATPGDLAPVVNALRAAAVRPPRKLTFLERSRPCPASRPRERSSCLLLVRPVLVACSDTTHGLRASRPRRPRSQPREVTVVAVERTSGQPVAGVAVTAGGTPPARR